jgi:hypothetical protein
MENEVTTLSIGQKIIAGLLLASFIVLPIIVICAYWPDKISKDDCAYWYKNEAFHVRLLANSCDTVKTKPLKKDLPGNANTPPIPPSATDGAKPPANPTANQGLPNWDGVNDGKTNNTQNSGKKSTDKLKGKQFTSEKIHLNTLILLLVAVGGFLGNMIYVAKSFTAFVGAETFNRNWILWYTVKPFIAAGLAVVFYLAFNNMPNAAEAINLNRIVAIAALTGLFTDIAMLKLKEVFEVVIKPTPDKTLMRDPKKMQISVKDIKPDKIDVNAPNPVTIPGQGLEAEKLTVKINDTVVKDIKVTPTLITFTYIVADKTIASFTLVVIDNEGQELGRKVL